MNPGIIPLKLGSAKLQESAFNLIHYYDLNQIVLEVNKLKNKSHILAKTIESNPEYKYESINYFGLLFMVEEKVETKLREIMPIHQRPKRGLINGLGSIFKSISGNLDASDGERYDKIIKTLEQNQQKLANSIAQQNSVSINLINQFNMTIRKISTNEKILESKINEILLFIEGSEGHSLLVINYLNQMINLYEIINSVLQDIENSISFAKLNTIHPSIIKTTDLFNELLKVEKHLNKNQFPLAVTSENIFIFQNLIDIECYINDKKITYILKVPITQVDAFEYFHLYSIPIFNESQFKAIIPQNKFLLKNKLHYAFKSDPCKKIQPQYFICREANLQEVSNENPCELQLLNADKTPTCQQTAITVTKPKFQKIDSTNQFIGILPHREEIKLICNNEEETLILIGTYLFDVPIDCKISSSQGIFVNERPIITSQSILLSRFGDLNNQLPLQSNVTINLHNVKLDELHTIRSQVLERPPEISPISPFIESPNLWTISIYGILIIAICYTCYKKFPTTRCTNKAERKPEPAIELANVQLPR